MLTCFTLLDLLYEQMKKKKKKQKESLGFLDLSTVCDVTLLLSPEMCHCLQAARAQRTTRHGGGTAEGETLLLLLFTQFVI